MYESQWGSLAAACSENPYQYYKSCENLYQVSNPEVLFKALISPIGQFIIHIYTRIRAVALTTP